jgi:putative membrane protein insertion efficiency factor
MSPLAVVLALPLRLYRLVVSPLLGQRCRFAPTCSRYALDALEQHGAIRGSWLAVRRVGRCHPWHPGGHDPVPPARSVNDPSEVLDSRRRAGATP